MLNECLLAHNFQNNCSTECHCITQKTIEVLGLHNNCHKIYLSGPFAIFCLYVILTISYLRAQTVETSSLPTDSSRPLFEQIEIFSSIPTVYLDCKYVLSLIYRYARVTRVPPRDFASGRNPCGGNNKKNITQRLEDMNFIFSWQKQYERSE